MVDVVMVIAQDVFRDEEYADPKRVLEERGANVITASVEPGECHGKLSMTAIAAMSVADAAKREWDAAVFIGGAGASVFFDNEAAHKLAKDTLERGSVVAAICIAPSTLARAGMLGGKRATSFSSQERDLRAHGALWTGNPVEIDGRIITANGPAAAESFGRAIANLLGLPEFRSPAQTA